MRIVNYRLPKLGFFTSTITLRCLRSGMD